MKSLITKPAVYMIILASTALMSFCKKDKTVSSSATSGDVPEIFRNSYKSTVALSTEGDYVVFKSNGLPDHASPYWQGVNNTLYEAPETGHIKNPGIMGTQNFTMKILKAPKAAASPEATSLGPIGMAINGVAIYNDREGGNVAIEAITVSTFDRGGGHSGPMDLYHYHCEPTFISKNDSKLIGFLMDGYPIYGRKDKDGTSPSNLDSDGGHTSATTEYPNGIYHYHCSNVNYLGTGYYILKSGSYHGVKGTFTF